MLLRIARCYKLLWERVLYKICKYSYYYYLCKRNILYFESALLICRPCSGHQQCRLQCTKWQSVYFYLFSYCATSNYYFLTGQTSCGKTTVFQFLFHFYDASSLPFPFNPPSGLASYLTYFAKDIKPPIKVHSTTSLTPPPPPPSHGSLNTFLFSSPPPPPKKTTTTMVPSIQALSCSPHTPSLGFQQPCSQSYRILTSLSRQWLQEEGCQKTRVCRHSPHPHPPNPHRTAEMGQAHIKWEGGRRP